jgi:hypothetical protein
MNWEKIAKERGEEIVALKTQVTDLLETRGDLERQLIEMSKPAAPKIPVADWECGVCGWIGIAVPIMEVSQRHYEWNKAKGQGCSGIQSRQKHLAK